MSTQPKMKFPSFLPPEAICLYVTRPILRGAIAPGIDFSAVDTDDGRFIMRSQYFTTGKRIHGIWHYESPNQLFFLGYECLKCGEIFLVPDSVKSHAELSDSMKHGCNMDLSEV